jgi:hypothetical protein
MQYAIFQIPIFRLFGDYKPPAMQGNSGEFTLRGRWVKEGGTVFCEV